MVNLSFKEISDKLTSIDFPKVDFVVGIARGGVIPASMIAHQLKVDLYTLSINYRDDQNQPRYDQPQILTSFLQNATADLVSSKILLVDDVSVTGKTLKIAIDHLSPHVDQIITFTLKGTADLVAFPEISSCVNWPWKAPDPAKLKA